MEVDDEEIPSRLGDAIKSILANHSSKFLHKEQNVEGTDELIEFKNEESKVSQEIAKIVLSYSSKKLNYNSPLTSPIDDNMKLCCAIATVISSESSKFLISNSRKLISREFAPSESSKFLNSSSRKLISREFAPPPDGDYHDENYDDDDDEGYDDDSDGNTDYTHEGDEIFDPNRAVNMSRNLLIALGFDTSLIPEIITDWRPPATYGLNNSLPIIPIVPNKSFPMRTSNILAKIDNTINGFLLNPIISGFFLKFSHSEYNAENMIYVLEINRFKYLCSDPKIWSETFTYKFVDKDFPNFDKIRLNESDLVFGGMKEWPSTKIPFASFKDHAQTIWDKYLSNLATTQICMPAHVLSNTIHRLRYMDLYGPRVFDETLIDPIKTLDKDVRPRFIQSPIYTSMSRRLNALYPLRKATTLHVTLPTNSACFEWTDDKLTVSNLRNISMYELFYDQFLYEEFLKYSKTIYAEENLFLCRSIAIFKRQFVHARASKRIAADVIPPAAEEQAWFIFHYFIIPGIVIYRCTVCKKFTLPVLNC